MDVKNNYLAVLQRIEKLENTHKNQVKLLTVSKKHSLESIQDVYALGQRAFGESYAQEGMQKIQALESLDIEWHFIGPLQSNKTKIIAEHFDWVQSVDSLKLLRRLNAQRPADKPALNVLIQLNISDESQKRGVSLEQAVELFSASSEFSRLYLRGIMAIPENTACLEQQLENFAKCRSVFELLQKKWPVDTLSMGMSSDLQAAIQSGSNMVRIGTDIFGQRI